MGESEMNWTADCSHHVGNILLGHALVDNGNLPRSEEAE
jgi:hypothetical protein